MSVVDELNTVEGVTLQLRIWSYALTGDMLEVGACVAEARDIPVSGIPVWDRTARALAREFIGAADEPYRRVKDWAALPWVSEHIMRGHEPWPGL